MELNFERQPELAQLFASKDPNQILRLIELQYNAAINPGETLLFLDEIQAAPQVFEALRYFFEERARYPRYRRGFTTRIRAGRAILCRTCWTH